MTLGKQIYVGPQICGFVNTVRKLRKEFVGYSRVTEQLSASQDGFHYTEFITYLGGWFGS
jgi:hypothetical protein